METQTLNDALGDKSDSQQPKTIDTGRKYVSTQEYPIYPSDQYIGKIVCLI